MKLLDFQIEALEETKDFNRVAYYFDMGLGKTFVGAEKLNRLNAPIALVVCQKSKVDDWLDHFKTYYEAENQIYDLTNKKQFDSFIVACKSKRLFNVLGVINYDLLIRRPDLKNLKGFTLMLDESQAIANDTSQRTKFILKMNTANVILLSGTPVSGRYEQLLPQLRLLGVTMTKQEYWDRYVNYKEIRPKGLPPYFPPVKVVTGYKNVDTLKLRLKRFGARFLKSDDVLTLPEQIFENIAVKTTPDYRKFKKARVLEIDGKTLVGDTTFKTILYERVLCGAYNQHKLTAFKDLIESSNERFIVFYNFNAELDAIKKAIGKDRPISVVCGSEKDLTAYEAEDNSISLIQYQSGASGLNLQKATRIIYFSPPMRSELYEQSKKRIHRIGQSNRCFYYSLVCENSIEEKIYNVLAMRKDYTDKLFEGEDE